MNDAEFQNWIRNANRHQELAQSLIEQRIELKESMTAHIKHFFDFDEIEFSRNFDKILLKWEWKHNPIINSENIVNLNMDWIITAQTNDRGFNIVAVELYPFKIPKFQFSDVGDDPNSVD